LEYYKYIQVGYFQARTGKHMNDIRDFKNLRDNDIDFMAGWDIQMETLKRTFTKNFPLYEGSPEANETVSTFRGGTVDFGDQLLYKTVMTAQQNMWCIFSNDSDFYSFPDELYLLTTNGEVIKKAAKEGKLYHPVQ